jgi:integrase
MNMNDEKLKDLLFGAKSKDVSLRTFSTLKGRKLLPVSYSQASIQRWKRTFVGDFLLNHPSRSGLIMDIKEAIGCTPQLSDFTEGNLNKIADKLKECAPNTARQNASRIKSTITRLLESDECMEIVPCKRYAKILNLEGCPTTKTYMGIDDLKKFFSYEPANEGERVCQARYAVMLMTGARHSDVCNFKRANIQDGVLTYVPQKTKSHGTIVTIPVSEAVARYIDILSNAKYKYNIAYFNSTIREICKKCGLDEEVTYFWGGKYVTKPKWEAMRSHLGRASFVTNMLKMGLQMHEVSKMAGHTNIAMTSRYNASTDVKLTKEADDFLNMKF